MYVIEVSLWCRGVLDYTSCEYRKGHTYGWPRKGGVRVYTMKKVTVMILTKYFESSDTNFSLVSDRFGIELQLSTD